MSKRIIDWKQLKNIVPYSRQHIKRMEDAGTFPIRVRLSQERVGWLADEIEHWIVMRVKERDEQTP